MPIRVVLFTTACLFLIAATSAAPAPHYLAINPATRQCGEYWPGDEYVNYDLPEGWDVFPYQYSDSDWSAETPAGNCSVPASVARSSFAEACCSLIRYTYVPGNIGVYRLTAGNIANQKAMEDYLAKQAAQERAEILMAILPYAIVFVSIALVIATIAQWRHERRNR